MHLLKGFIRFPVFFIVMVVPYLVHGGHLHVLWQPAIILIQSGLYLFSIAFYASFRRPVTSEDFQRLQVAGKTGLLMSMVIPPTLGFVMTMGFIDQETLVVGHSLGASAVSFIYAVLIFGSFFPVFFIKPSEDAVRSAAKLDGAKEKTAA